MASKFKYLNVSEIANDFENFANPIYCKYGEIKQIAFNKISPLEDGFVILYISTFKNKYSNTDRRYSLTLAEFLLVDFSKELPGLILYLALDSANTIDSWEILIQETKDSFNNRAVEKITDGTLYLDWPFPSV